MGKFKNKLGVLALAGSLALGVANVHANLVLNGGFESGLADWTIAPVGGSASTTSDAHSGSDAVDLKAGRTTPIQLYQSVALVPFVSGTTYDLSFWLKNMDTGGSGVIEVDLDGVFGTAIQASNVPSSYTFYSFILKPNYTPAELSFLFAPGPGDSSTMDFHLDDVSLVAVAAVPEAGTMIAGALLLLPLCASTLRIVRNKSQKRLKMSRIGIDGKMSL